MQLAQKIKQFPKEIKIFLVIFYTVGIIAIYTPYTSSIFMALTPLALIMSFVFLMLFHSDFDIKSVRIFSFILAFGYLIEVIGVNTGMIFGNYKYGDNLGFKLFETPLIIGFNWLLMIYITASMVEKLKAGAFYKILLASGLMIIYDLVLEQLAPTLDFWSWENNIIPIQNYIAWFCIAVFFHSILKIYKIKTINTLALTIYLCQVLFFFSLLFMK